MFYSSVFFLANYSSVKKLSAMGRVLYSVSLMAMARLDPAGEHMTGNPPYPSGVGLPESSGELALDSASPNRTNLFLPSVHIVRLHAVHDGFDEGLDRRF
jgi:hypothetical protein